MKHKNLYALWGGMYLICGLLGLIPDPAGTVRGLLTAAALLCFLPPFFLFRQAKAKGDKRTLSLLRNLSAMWLGLTALLIGLNVASLGASETVGNLLYTLLVILSSPMVCGGNWLIAMFLWACLLIASQKEMKGKF